MSELWKQVDPGNSGDTQPSQTRATRQGIAIIAGLATLLTVGYAMRGVAGEVLHAIEPGSSSSGTAPNRAQGDPLQDILQPEAVTLAGKAIKLTGRSRNGAPAVFQAVQAGPNKVVLTAGSDSFEDGIIFNGRAALVDVTLTGPGIDAADLTPSDAQDVSHIFIETTTGIPHSQGSAIDRQVDISSPAASQSRDRSDLLYAVSGERAGEAWSGVYGVNDDRNYNGYVGYTSDPNTTLTGPGPNHGLPEFDTGYWGGGSPPPLYADGGNASQQQTAQDVVAQAGTAFHAALTELQHR